MRVAVAVLAVAMVVAAWVGWVFLQPLLARYGYVWQITELGSWGDSFGALTSFFTAIGFIAIGATFWLQRRQLIGAEQSHQIERFDSLYFELLRLVRETRKDVRYRYSDDYMRRTTGEKKMVYDTEAFRRAWREISYLWETNGRKESIDEVTSLYETTLHDRFESGFAPYFRSVFTMLRLIDEANFLTEERKVFYGNLIRAQLNSYELAVIGLNALSPVSGDLKRYLVRFRMLKYLPQGSTRRQLLEPHYESSAFLGR